jgi:hypothetical protein
MTKSINFQAINLYHGSPFRIERFCDDFLGHGHDQLGSGFYATTNRASAKGYAQATPDKLNHFSHLRHAETVHTLRCYFKKTLDAKTVQPLTIAQVKAIILQSPELNDALENFGDVNYEGFESVLNRALPLFAGDDESPLIKVLNTLSNDFFHDSPAAFNLAAHLVLGYDSVIEHFPDGSNVCIWFAKDIEIIRRQTLRKEHECGVEP